MFRREPLLTWIKALPAMLAGLCVWDCQKPNSRNTLVGLRIPGALLAKRVDGQVKPVRAYDVMGNGRTLAIGAPGAFTPVRSEQHVSGLVANADRLRRSGFHRLVCIVASDPFVTHAWAKVVDPEQKIRFVSDGNLNCAKALGCVTHEQRLFLGDRSERYLLSVRDTTIETVRVELNIANYSCTMADDLVIA